MSLTKFSVLALLALLFAAPAPAVEIVGGERVVIPAGEVKDDDVIAGTGTFVLEGTIRGDLIVAAGAVTIAPGGVVEGDLIATGRSIAIEGTVRDDVRIGGMALTLGGRSKVGDDLIAAGPSLETRPGSLVLGTLLFGGAQVLLAGDVTEGARLAAGGVELRGRIGGDVHAEVGGPGETIFTPLAFFQDLPPVPKVASGLTVLQGARIGGNLDYVAPQDVALPLGAVAGKVSRREPEAAPARSAAEELARSSLQTLAALLVVGLLLLWIVPAPVQDGAAVLRNRPAPSLGWGVASVAAAFVGTLTLALTAALAAVLLGAFSLGELTAVAIFTGMVLILAFVLTFVVLAVYVSKVVVAYLGGRLILARIKPAWAEKRVAPLLVGVLVLVLLGALPVLGTPIHLLAALLGLGALWLLARDRFRKRRTAAPVPQAVPEPVQTHAAAA